MGHSEFDRQNQRKIEKFILILFTIYSLCMMLLTVSKDKAGWVIVIMALDLVIAWGMYLTKFRKYRTRVMLTTCLMQISMLVYATQVKDVCSVLAIFVAFVIFTGFYGVLEALYVTTVSTVLMFLYHWLIADTAYFTSVTEGVRMALQIANLILTQGVMYIWVKKRRESSEELLKTIEAQREVEQSKDDFLANVSHEIRTPINTICGMSEIALKENDPKKIKENVVNIQSAGRHLMSVVGDILDFSELQSGKVELEEEAYNITTTINDIINMALTKKEAKHIELIVNCDADIPRGLYGDEKKIRRVIMNILDNAIKFTNEGCVILSVTSQRIADGIALHVVVKDTGIGIKQENLEKLFTSFLQVNAKRNRVEGGLGLGLPISQTLLQKMGGSIDIKSEYGRGTSVEIVIPQRVLDEKPVVSIKNKEKLNIAVYIDMGQFAIPALKEQYAGNMRNMIERLDVRCAICQNLAELKEQQAKKPFTHIFISWLEYKEDSAYFNELAKQIKVIVIIDTRDEKDIQSVDICRIYKPFYILPIAAVLNGEVENVVSGDRISTNKFIAPSAHILVVDDNEMNLQVIEALLEHYQIKVTRATSGMEALDKIETMDYDFVFMDHMMPEMDGVETLHRIRYKVGEYYQQVPIIVLTANAIAGARERFLEDGFADFLEKPIEVSVLERVLRRNLPTEKILEVDARDISDTKNGAQDIVDTENGAQVAGKETADNGQGAACNLKLDADMGFLYCGGEKGYRKVLDCYRKTGDENCERIEALFAAEDWKNYTIAVHGVKSAMLSVGAKHLSELAKKLELAGKEGDIVYIREHHREMVEEYRLVIGEIKQHPLLREQEKTRTNRGEKPETTVDVSSLPQLSDEELEKMIQALEAAMYNLDGTRMLELLTELERYQYGGVVLREQLQSVRRKIEMSDYMSAVDVVIKLRERLRNNG